MQDAVAIVAGNAIYLSKNGLHLFFIGDETIGNHQQPASRAQNLGALLDESIGAVEVNLAPAVEGWIAQYQIVAATMQFAADITGDRRDIFFVQV